MRNRLDMKEKFKKIWAFIIAPPTWFLVISYFLTVIFIALALTLVVIGNVNPVIEILSYISYAFAGISLAYTVYTIVRFAPKMKNLIVNLMRKSKIVSKLLDDWGYRTVIFAVFSLIINIAYSVFNGVIALLVGSIWYGALATYYILLTLLRGSIVAYHKNKGKYREEDVGVENVIKYRRCGVLLIILPLSLSFAILQMVRDNNAFIHYGWVVYAVALYAFYKITMAIYNMFKAKKNDDMTVKALRCVSLADALVSILALQTTLLHAFSNGGTFVAFANALTGACVCAITLILGVYMVVNANKKLKQEKRD